MTVKEIFKYVMLNDIVEIIDHKNHSRYWCGHGTDIPLRYCDSEVKQIYSEEYDYGYTEIVISINV